VASSSSPSSSSADRRRGFFDDLVRTETRIYNAVGERLRAEHGIVTSQFELLRYLGAHADARVADMATVFAAGIGAVSKGVDRLEARGWAARVPNPADRRSSLVRLTASGTALVAAAQRTFDEELERLIAPSLSEEQVDAVAGALGAVRRALEDARIGLPIG
jgi:MarR family multiple antibiotic resistance transcriptional regulator